MGVGKLQFQLFYGEEAYPVSDAQILVFDNILGIPVIDGTLSVDSSGKSDIIELYAPDKSLSLVPIADIVPYSTYSAIVFSNTFKNSLIQNIEIFDGITAIEKVQMIPKTLIGDDITDINITPHGLLEDKIPVAKPLPPPNSKDKSPKILDKPIIPSNITVHLGSPTSSAANVTVPFTEYIKNVASSEIYPTWPENAIKANIIAQISFTLNRIYTEWYRSRGYNFDITNSTAYDHYYVDGRDIFENISKIVDEIFDDYISRKTFLEPLLAQYCNGTTVTCDGLSQWGTVDLANQGLTPYQILAKYYGNNIELRNADVVQYAEESYPGTALKLGSSGEDVKSIQNQLNRIGKNYPAIPNISPVDGNFNSVTEEAVKVFQKVFNLTPDGVVGKSTWYKISQIYVGVKNLAELESEGEKIPVPDKPPTTTIRKGDTGEIVKLAQFFLACIAAFYDNIPPIKITGTFDADTEAAVKAFQQKFGLEPDGIIGRLTWAKLYAIFLTVEPYIFTESGKLPSYPGYLIREGSRGDDVKTVQKWLSSISEKYTQIPKVSSDGIFGSKTKAAVIAFQKQFGLDPDGIVGKLTWDKLYQVFLSVSSPGDGTGSGSGNGGSGSGNTGGTGNGGSGGSSGNGSSGSGNSGGSSSGNTGGTEDGCGSASGSGNGNTVLIPYPGYLIKEGSRGNDVEVVQKWLAAISAKYPQIPKIGVDGKFGPQTKAAVIAFQKQFGLEADGIVGKLTWDKLYRVNKSTR